MRFIDVLRISFRMLRTNGLRSLLTILGIGVAISLIVLLIGVGYGLQNITIGSIVQSKTLLSMDIKPIDDQSPQLTLQTVDMVKKTAGVRDVSPVILTDGELSLDNKLASTTVVGAYPSYLEMEGINIKPGGNTYTENAQEVVISPKVLELLDLPETGVVGGEISLSYTDPNNQNESKHIDKALIVGITDTTDQAVIYAPYELLDPAGNAKLSVITATATDRNALVTASASITHQGFVVDTLVETLDQARSIFRWVTIGLAAFGTIALVVAAIGMFNTLTISLLERTREIGIMKAIGVTDKAVKQLFLTEAAMIGILGGLAGIAIGLIMGQLIGLVLNQVAIRFGGIQLHLFQYPSFFLISMVIYPLILALITGLYPAIRASRLNPLRALRYE